MCWWPSTRGLSQILLQVREVRSRKWFETCIVLGTSQELMSKYGDLRIFANFPKKSFEPFACTVFCHGTKFFHRRKKSQKNWLYIRFFPLKCGEFVQIVPKKSFEPFACPIFYEVTKFRHKRKMKYRLYVRLGSLILLRTMVNWLWAYEPMNPDNLQDSVPVSDNCPTLILTSNCV